jgi:hypothetical protein|nr:MAG TPA: hypothetical protein [Caudoviricetes sp.]
MEKQTFTAVYPQPKTFLKYDAGHIIVYPNETVIENYTPAPAMEQQEEVEPFTAYQYEGTERDGGFIVECDDPTDYHSVANAIVRTRYSVSEELALQRHHQQDPEAYEAEFSAYCNHADRAVVLAKRWLRVVG